MVPITGGGGGGGSCTGSTRGRMEVGSAPSEDGPPPSTGGSEQGDNPSR